MSIQRKADRVLEQARRLAEKVSSWADFSAALFDYSSGLVPRMFPDEMERQAFFDSPQNEEVDRILINLMRKFGVIGGAAPKEKSGRFLVRVPKTLHQKLEVEAQAEGVSLNQLAVTKLSVPLEEGVGLSDPRPLIIQAFNAVHEGHSQDWVILESHHNRLFIERCRQLGLTLGEYDLNHLLMNIRKTKKYKGRLNRTAVRSGFQDYDDCFFAAEIAIRTLQRTRGVTLDQVLCDPALRAQFDEIATKLAPGQTELKLRCAALNLRKTHRLRPEDASSAQIESCDLVNAGPVGSISPASISSLPGAYVFYDHTRPIYAGETDNLQRRIGLHLASGLPEWLEAKEDEGFILKFSVLPSVKKEDRLKWLGAFINRERPVLNYQEVA
jgi:hypothetical protein